jgi:hypothetical protein
MISTGGLAPLAALALIDRQGDRFAEAIRTEPAAKREIARFRDRIGKIESVDELVKDHQLYSFVMKAFGLEGEIFAKAMMKRILTSDPADKGSLVNRLTDPRYREINRSSGSTPTARSPAPALAALPGPRPWWSAMSPSG